MLPTFCDKCGTMHGKGRPCDPKGLKARSSTVEPSAHNAPIAGSTPAAPTNTRPVAEQVDAPDLKSESCGNEGSNPSGPTIEEIIEVTSAVGKKLFPEDPTPTPLEVRLSKTVSQTDVENAIIRAKDIPFDRTTYQRDYMRDLPKAKAEGLTVKQWREKHKND